MPKLPSISNILFALWLNCFLSTILRDGGRSTLLYTPHWLTCRSVQQAFFFFQALVDQQAVEPQYQTPVRWSAIGFLNQQEMVLTQCEGGWNWQSKGGCGRWPRSIPDHQNEQKCSFHQGIKNKFQPWIVLEKHHPTLILFNPSFHCSSLPGLAACQKGEVSCLGL